MRKLLNTNVRATDSRNAASVPVRGFMLDVSRGRIPTQDALKALIVRLARLGYNQFQLYIEHTFAFPGHEAVWRDASPLTAEEIRELDALCREHGIEFVPNLNSFGHVENWLKHERYKPLAECPDGFYHAVFKMQRVAGTFAAGEASADFMDALYREFLPHFSSDKFNIGGDEPWELGQGRSRALCEQKGKRAVYIEHMERLKQRARVHGKKILFWGDVLLGESEEIPSAFLRDTIPVIWGYDAGHPFDAQCARVREALEKIGNDGEFYLAPGTSAWLSFGTRQTNALANIREACAAAKTYGAHGVLLTTWGDFGYHNPFVTNWVPMITCAAAMQGVPVPETAADFAKILETVLELPNAETLAEALLEFGRLDTLVAKKITNRSISRELFFARGDAFERIVEGIELSEILESKALCERVLARLESVPEERRGVEEQELHLSVCMAHAALRRAEAFLNADAEARSRVEAEIAGPLKERFAAVWRLRNREGGLANALRAFD